MWRTNLKVVALGLVVIAFYTTIAHMIPQLESEVPEALDLSSGVTPEALAAAGERLFTGAGGCTACHGLGTRAPNLLTDHAGEGPIGARCGTREPGKDCKAYLYESMTQPAAYVVKGFDVLMPDMRRQFSEDQIWALVAYLESQGGQITVTAEDIKSTGGAASAAAAAPVEPAPAAAAADVPAPAAAPATPAAPIDAGQQALVTAGEQLFNGDGGCTACHNGIGRLAPNLRTPQKGEGPIGARCGNREPGKDCNAYLFQSLTEPTAFVVAGFDPIMPEMRTKFSDQQLWSLIAFLEAQGGKVTVTDAVIKGGAPGGRAPGAAAAPAAAAAEPEAAPAAASAEPAAAPAPAAPPAAATLDPQELLTRQGCLGCHSIDGDGAETGPALDKVGSRRNADGIRRKILDPTQEIAPGFEDRAGLMPRYFGQRLSAAQLEALVKYLAARQ